MSRRDSPSKLDESAYKTFITHKKETYNNLARDSLTILGIQLLALPVGLSLISIVLVAGGSTTLSQIFGEVARGENQAIVWALTANLISISITLICYYFSRKYSMRTSNYLLDYYKEDDFLPYSTDRTFPLNHLFGFYNTIREGVYRHSRTDYKRDGYSTLDQTTNADNGIRVLLITSLIATLSAIWVILAGIGGSIFTPIWTFSQILLGVALTILISLGGYLLAIPVLERIIESIIPLLSWLYHDVIVYRLSQLNSEK